MAITPIQNVWFDDAATVLTRIESDPSRRKHNISDSGIRTRVSCDLEVMMFVDLSQSILFILVLSLQLRFVRSSERTDVV
jgi:hypothetical protein